MDHIKQAEKETNIMEQIVQRFKECWHDGRFNRYRLCSAMECQKLCFCYYAWDMDKITDPDEYLFCEEHYYRIANEYIELKRHLYWEDSQGYWLQHPTAGGLDFLPECAPKGYWLQLPTAGGLDFLPECAPKTDCVHVHASILIPVHVDEAVNKDSSSCGDSEEKRLDEPTRNVSN